MPTPPSIHIITARHILAAPRAYAEKLDQSDATTVVIDNHTDRNIIGVFGKHIDPDAPIESVAQHNAFAKALENIYQICLHGGEANNADEALDLIEELIEEVLDL